jgi:hypothetical protein
MRSLIAKRDSATSGHQIPQGVVKSDAFPVDGSATHKPLPPLPCAPETPPLPRSNLLKIDDLLLRVGSTSALIWLLAVIAGLTISLNGHLAPGQLLAAMAVAATAPIGLLIGGFRLRRREDRAWSLHRMIDDHVEIPASELLRDSDFTPESLARAIRDLNNAGAAFVVWDRKSDVIQDGRLRSSRIQVEECAACGAKVSTTVRLGDAGTARCPFCHDLMMAESLMEEKARVIDELDTDPATLSARNRPGSRFSPGVFLVLTLVFWPLAVGYAFWCWQAGARSA